MSRPRWFTVASHGRYVVRRGALVWWPCSTAHLKEPGTAVTACGEAHPRWQVFWELDFFDGSIPRCVDCVAVAARTLDLRKARV